MIFMTRGITGLTRCFGSSFGMTLPPDSNSSTAMSDIMPPPNDAGDAMVCDPSTPLLTMNGMITSIQGTDEENPHAPPDDKEEIAEYGLGGTSFTRYASFLLKPVAGSGGSESNVPENVKSLYLLTLVKFLEKELGKVTEAASLELKKSKEAFAEEASKLRIEYEKKVNDANSISEAKIRELSRQLEELSLEHSATQLCHLSCALNTPGTLQLELQDCKVQAQNAKDDFESKLRRSQEAKDASDKEVERLNSSIQEKDKALEELTTEACLLMSKFQKVETQLAQIELKAAQESLASGSYADGHANPSMLEDACKSVDKATDNLMRILHERSITSKFTDQKQLSRFLSQLIGPTGMANFSRPVQMKYAWGHWVCNIMFQAFEHVFFDVDGGTRTSPLDSKTYSSECFHSFQQKQHMPSRRLYEECDLFRAYCVRKYPSVFPLALVKQALHPQLPDSVVHYDSYGRFNNDAEIYQHFLDVAKAIWLLHQLSFAFDPPAHILRMAPGLPFDKQYHEPVIHGEDSDGMHQTVLLMIRPGFRLRNTIFRSRVFLSISGRVEISKTAEEQHVEQRSRVPSSSAAALVSM